MPRQQRHEQRRRQRLKSGSTKCYEIYQDFRATDPRGVATLPFVSLGCHQFSMSLPSEKCCKKLEARDDKEREREKRDRDKERDKKTQ